MNKNDLLYSAGFFDGEGCITTSGNSGFRACVSNTEKEILTYFLKTFGGHINDQHLPSNPNHNMAWKWVIVRKSELLTFLKLVYPHLKLKKEQAGIVINFLTNYPNYGFGKRIPTQESKVSC